MLQALAFVGPSAALTWQDPSQRPARDCQWSPRLPLPSVEMVPRVQVDPPQALKPPSTRGPGRGCLAPSHPARNRGWVSLSPLPRSQAWGGLATVGTPPSGAGDLAREL